MLTDYLEALMRRAKIELLPNDRIYYGEITEAPGVYATGKSTKACREELREVLEGWALLSMQRSAPSAHHCPGCASKVAAS